MRATILLLALARALSSTPDGTDHTEPPGLKHAKAVITETRDLVRNGKVKQAQDRLKQVIRTLEAEQGTEEARSEAYGQLGTVYTKASKETEAIAAFETAADVLHGKFGASDPRTSVAADRLADAYVQAKMHAKAVPLFQRLLTEMKAHLGVSHPGYRLTLGKLAEAATHDGKPKVAIKAYREMLEVMEQEPDGPGKPGETAKVRMRLARQLGGSGALEEALEHANAARALHESGAVEDDVDGMEHAFSVNAAAGILEKMGRDDEAISTMALAATMAEQTRPADDPLVQAAHRNLAGLKKHIARKRSRGKEL